MYLVNNSIIHCDSYTIAYPIKRLYIVHNAIYKKQMRKYLNYSVRYAIISTS